MNDFLKKMFIDEAKPALNRHSGSGGGASGMPIEVGALPETGVEGAYYVLKASKMGAIIHVPGEMHINLCDPALGDEAMTLKVVDTYPETPDTMFDKVLYYITSLNNVYANVEENWFTIDALIGVELPCYGVVNSIDDIREAGIYVLNVENTVYYKYENSSFNEIDKAIYKNHLEELIDGRIKDIVISKNCLGIRNHAFADLTELENITYENGIDSILSFGTDYTFYRCYNLKNIELPTSGQALPWIGDHMFCSCESITSLVLPEGVSSIGNGAFSGCTNLSDINIPDSVTNIGEFAFNRCRELTSIDIPDSVEYIGKNAFSYCSKLENITLPSNITFINDSAFSNCSGFTKIVIPEGVIEIGEFAFYHCENVSEIVIPKSVTKIGRSAFYQIPSVKHIYYTGTEEQFNAINMDSANDILTHPLINKTFNYVPE